ncbi:probable peptidyl-tRNA hydrolase 2 isoform X2 [Alnus glutinosa]|uniref:probable peptidyl-tRNA hydrolase 2 isoform X2 n=1 Tax=Alnus glutinosa TaxID=3517 RepID=UPI002D76CF01|nr:probable peptidyl-tRNA hydrolase 2 isoform X2 [Alnus glutinosa]
MLGSFRNPSQSAKKQLKQEREWLALSFRPENFIPGLVIGFIFGLLLDLSKPSKNHMRKQNFSPGKPQQEYLGSNIDDQEMKMVCPVILEFVSSNAQHNKAVEISMGHPSVNLKVLVVRQDLKMKSGKIASQCAHAATGMYAELMQRYHCTDYDSPHPCAEEPAFSFLRVVVHLAENFNRPLLRQWEQCGQPKIVVTCKNQQEMNKLKDAAETIGLPTFNVADAGRTQVLAGSKTVLAIGPGPKASVDSVTGKLCLL